ncbi:TIGR03087 family PEP-CTERM/XrtA system glycosyltransferase [Thermodesulfobacteriota bacterium B35]
MRILLLTHRIPYPPNKGDKIRSYHQLQYLLERGSVYLGTLIDDPRDLGYADELGINCEDTFFAEINTKAKRFISALYQVATGKPASVTYFHDRKLQQWINIILDSRRIDLIFCFSSTMAEYLFRSPSWKRIKEQGVQLVMDFCDVDSRKWQDYGEIKRWPLSTFFRREGKLLQQYEQDIATAFDICFLASSRERRLFHQLHGGQNVSVLQNGVDLDFFSNRESTVVEKNTSPVLVFTGAMDYDVNIDGVLWFVSYIWPRIIEKAPDVRFYVVGSNPTREIKSLEQKGGITVTGYVEDIREYYKMATICVAPLRIARGIQNKILEAMAMTKPVICTSNAFEGIIANPGQDLIVADEPEDFALSVLALLENSKKRQLIAERGRRCMEEKYSWDAQLSLLDQYIRFNGGKAS